jgi:hypothetical protein
LRLQRQSIAQISLTRRIYSSGQRMGVTRATIGQWMLLLLQNEQKNYFLLHSKNEPNDEPVVLCLVNVEFHFKERKIKIECTCFFLFCGTFRKEKHDQKEGVHLVSTFLFYNLRHNYLQKKMLRALLIVKTVRSTSWHFYLSP